METKIEIREIKAKQIHRNFLKDFNRYQEVTMVWRTVGGEKIIKDLEFVEDWDNDTKIDVVNNDLLKTISNAGHLFCAYEDELLIGFATINGKFIGENNDYLQLQQLQVSYGYRGKGIGRKLFDMCARYAKSLGAEKLYISAQSSVETMSFYSKVGCVDAIWTYKEQEILEPCDCKLEYKL